MWRWGKCKKLLVKTPYGKVIGIDYSEVSVIKSSKINKAEIENKHCEILQGNVMKLPFRKETFDIITAFETIYFWPDINEEMCIRDRLAVRSCSQLTTLLNGLQEEKK